MNKRTDNSLSKLVDDGRQLVIETEVDYRRYQVLARSYGDRLRRISTVDTDPELPHVQEENRLRDEHNQIVKALRDFEAREFMEVGHV